MRKAYQTFAFPVKVTSRNRNLRTYAYGRHKEKCTVRIDLETLRWVTQEAERLGCSTGSLIGFALQAARERSHEGTDIADLVRQAEVAYCQRFGLDVPTRIDCSDETKKADQRG